MRCALRYPRRITVAFRPTLLAPKGVGVGSSPAHSRLPLASGLAAHPPQGKAHLSGARSGATLPVHRFEVLRYHREQVLSRFSCPWVYCRCCWSAVWIFGQRHPGAALIIGDLARKRTLRRGCDFAHRSSEFGAANCVPPCQHDPGQISDAVGAAIRGNLRGRQSIMGATKRPLWGPSPRRGTGSRWAWPHHRGHCLGD